MPEHRIRIGFMVTVPLFIVLVSCSSPDRPDTTAPVVKSISWSPEPVRAGRPVTFSVNAEDDGGNVSLLFDYDGDDLYETDNPSYEFTSPGAARVGILIFDESGNAVEESVTLTVRPAQGSLEVMNETAAPIEISVDGTSYGTIPPGGLWARDFDPGRYTVTGNTPGYPEWSAPDVPVEGGEVTTIIWNNPS